MANTNTLTQKVPRNTYYRTVDDSMAPRGKELYDLLQYSELNLDAYDNWFDDFQGDSLDAKYTAKNDGGSTSVALGTALLNTSATTAKYAGFTSDLGYSGAQNVILQARFALDVITAVKFEFGLIDAIAGYAGAVNALDDPTWTASADAVLFAFDTDGTYDCTQAMAMASAAPKKRVLYTAGTASASDPTYNTFTDTAATWAINSLAGQTITVSKTGYKTTQATVLSNTGAGTGVITIPSGGGSGTWGGWSDGIPVASSAYVIGNAPAALTVPVAAQSNTYTIKLEGTTARFYINGIQVARIADAVTLSTTKLCPWIFCQSRTGTRILSLDYLWAIQSRRVTA